MGRTGNMINKDFIWQMYVSLVTSAYFGDGDGVDSNPEFISEYLSHIETVSHSVRDR